MFVIPIEITKFVYPKNNLYIGGLIGKENISPMVMYTKTGKYSFFVNYNLVNNGCLLVGFNKEKGKVLDSKKTLENLMQLLKDSGDKEHEIEVV